MGKTVHEVLDDGAVVNNHVAVAKLKHNTVGRKDRMALCMLVLII